MSAPFKIRKSMSIFGGSEDADPPRSPTFKVCTFTLFNTHINRILQPSSSQQSHKLSFLDELDNNDPFREPFSSQPAPRVPNNSAEGAMETEEPASQPIVSTTDKVDVRPKINLSNPFSKPSQSPGYFSSSFRQSLRILIIISVLPQISSITRNRRKVPSRNLHLQYPRSLE
jgi:hypothetical protein